jgi:MFS transporter, MHS family, proline/betaine transporter
VARSRSTGLGIAYNLAVMIFGGFARFFVTWLIEATGLWIAPSFVIAITREVLMLRG